MKKEIIYLMCFLLVIIEDELRFVKLDFIMIKQIYFQNFENVILNNDIYIAFFDSNYVSFDNIKYKYTSVLYLY